MFRSRRSANELAPSNHNRSGPARTGRPDEKVVAFGERRFRRLADCEAPGAPAIEFGVRAGPPSIGFSPTVGAPAVRLRDVFTPTQPKPLGPLFIGRDQILNQLLCALEDERAHVVLFGARGRGKTSLANAVAALANTAGHLVLRQTCGAGTTFEGLFRSALGSAPVQAIVPAERQGLRTAAELLPAGTFGPPAAVAALQRLAAKRTLLIIDEFDRITADDVRSAIAETIKGLSDLQAPVALLLVGVSESLDHLLGYHPSIERNVIGLHLARMSEDEIVTLLEKGARTAGLDFSPETVDSVRRCSRGMPYYAHLLGLLSGRAAEQRGSRRIERADFLEAAALVRTKIVGHEGPVLGQFGLADETAHALLLFAAMAACDEHDRFDAGLVLEGASAGLAGISSSSVGRLLERLAGSRHAPVRMHQTPFGTRFSFTQPTLAHLLLLLHEAGLDWSGRGQLAHA